MTLDDNEKIEVQSTEGSFVERGLEQTGAEQGVGMDRTRQAHDHGDKKRWAQKTSMRYNRYGDNFLIHKIKPDEVGADMVSIGELVSDKEWQIIRDKENT